MDTAARERITFPEHLPVSQVRAEIAEAIRDHQVVVLAGETGSGKTTQLPKILLQLGRGTDGLIGHTQPRRIAARAVAERVAEELGTELGDVVGYTVRFHDQVSPSTRVKLMTDGILLAELGRDRDLSAYDTIVIDEAHERSLTIDFLLGYLKQLLPRRPDLKVVITSATIDPDRFSRHFDGAPVLEVSGRTYPVEVRYRPLEEDQDQVSGIVAACEELAREGRGDVLVFCSGEREIRDAADVLRGATDAEIVPLFGRLSAAEQHVVFAEHSRRRIVLATNVAETSLTVPGIRYVVDPGTARISRYSNRTKVQRLPIEPVSQASATQRAGRCGRVADGICIRLYSEEDFDARPEFTEPEILRTNLASVLLQLAALGLGDIEDFPFVEAPDKRQVRDGLQLLEELGALRDDGRLTKVGRQLAQLPLDPRMSRMIVEADRLGCLEQVLPIAAALSIQDPRERPLDKQEQAAELHGRFTVPGSDLLTWFELWRYVQEQQEALSSSAFRRMCKREMLSWLRIREWQDLHAQLRRVVRRMGMDPTTSGEWDAVSQALLAGLLSHVGVRQERDYLGARGVRFTIARGSALARNGAPLVVAAELVETERLYARGVSRIEPEWVEAVAGDLLVRSCSEPHWDPKRSAVMAYERVLLYGVPIVARRRIGYSRVDPVASRELFIQHALVERDWSTHHAFFQKNAELLDHVAELEQRARRRDIAASDHDIFTFYEERIPADVVSGAHFDRWWKVQRRETPHLLDLTLEDLLRDDAPDPSDHPVVWTSGDITFPMSYTFEPGAEADGVTVEVPLAQLHQVPAGRIGWAVPGRRAEIVAELIRALPKALRVQLVPAPDVARQIVPHVGEDEELLPALSREARRARGVVVPVDAWSPDKLPSHLIPRYRVVDDAGTTVGEGRDLDALKAELAAPAQAALTSAVGDAERTGLTTWSVGDLPDDVTAGNVIAYPTLVDEGSAVALRVLPQPSPQVHRAGVRRLLLLNVPSPVKAVSEQLPTAAKLALTANPHGSVSALMADALSAAVDTLMPDAPRTASAYAEVEQRVRAGLRAELLRVLTATRAVLDADAKLQQLLAGRSSPAVEDVRNQRNALVRPGFITELGAARLPDLARYLEAAVLRLERPPTRDALLMADVHAVEKELAQMPVGPGRDRIRWMVEELRVSLFAPSVKAKGPISVQRIWKAMDEEEAR
ncbi:MAG TPA: ATP-dependent RNA helicase HrpA [Mycobacteriales bacterium]|nr:ATP-dependent RNA helicase HrpA [Mycobacteriales bacterium]